MNMKSLKPEHIIIIILLILIGIGSLSKEQKSDKVNSAQPNADYTSPVQIHNCKFTNLPFFYDVYALASYESSNPINVVIDEKGNRNGSNDVIVNAKNKPVILVLSAYEPVAWKIKQTAGTKIAGVILGGYYKQAILGIPKSVPILNYSSNQNTCGNLYLSDRIDGNQLAAFDKIKNAAGKKPDSFKYQYNGGPFFVGQPVGGNDKLISSDDYKLSDYQVDLDAVSGNIPQNVRTSTNWKEDATVYLVSNNYLRQATALDIKAWEDKAKEPYIKKMGDAARQMQIEHEMGVGFTYIVQKTFSIPDDFCYGHYINFLIPPGINPPENKQNCGFFFMKDGSKL